jgi:hypothetical protein
MPGSQCSASGGGVVLNSFVEVERRHAGTLWELEAVLVGFSPPRLMPPKNRAAA